MAASQQVRLKPEDHELATQLAERTRRTIADTIGIALRAHKTELDEAEFRVAMGDAIMNRGGSRA